MVTKITYNWMYCTDKGYGEEYDTREVGRNDVVDIHEHLPRGAGDIHYCRVTYADGHQERITNINMVTSDIDGI